MTENNDQQANEQVEITRALRNFRNISDIEHFYRFVYDNNLRREAKMVFDAITSAITSQRKINKKKANGSAKKQK